VKHADVRLVEGVTRIIVNSQLDWWKEAASFFCGTSSKAFIDSFCLCDRKGIEDKMGWGLGVWSSLAFQSWLFRHVQVFFWVLKKKIFGQRKVQKLFFVFSGREKSKNFSLFLRKFNLCVFFLGSNGNTDQGV